MVWYPTLLEKMFFPEIGEVGSSLDSIPALGSEMRRWSLP